MPEPEFEAYLTLLSKLLHLTKAQNAEITAELRDHLEERLRELQDQGHDRARAIELALNELGDAAVLAVDFALPHLTRRRRQLMRYSLGSIAVITATFVLAAFYWPAQRHEPTTWVIAQAPPPKTDSSVADALAAAIAKNHKDEFRQQVEEKLARRDVDVAFEETPLEDVFSFLGDYLDVDFVLDRRYLSDNGIDGSAPVTLHLRAKTVTARTILELVLRQVSDGATMSYVIRDGLILITSPQEGYEVQVYDCRDLLNNVKIESPAAVQNTYWGARGGALGGGDVAAGAGGMPGGIGVATGGLGGMGVGVSTGPSGGTSLAATALINVIMAATGDNWLDRDGDGGTITEFDGLLIVRHSQRAHRNIEDLLRKLRETKSRAAPNTVYVPSSNGQFQLSTPGTPSPAFSVPSGALGTPPQSVGSPGTELEFAL